MINRSIMILFLLHKFSFPLLAKKIKIGKETRTESLIFILPKNRANPINS